MWMLCGCHLGVIWVLSGCHLGVVWMSFGCIVGDIWVLCWCHVGVLKNLKKIFKLCQSYSPVLFIFSISVPQLVTIERHLASFLRVRRLTCKSLYPYFDISGVKMCHMLMYSDIYDL